MGYYDGIGGESSCSAWSLARLTEAARRARRGRDGRRGQLRGNRAGLSALRGREPHRRRARQPRGYGAAIQNHPRRDRFAHRYPLRGVSAQGCGLLAEPPQHEPLARRGRAAACRARFPRRRIRARHAGFRHAAFHRAKREKNRARTFSAAEKPDRPANGIRAR